MKKVFQFIFSIYGFTVFLVVMLLLFPFVLLATLFGPVRGGNMVYNICRLWADLVLPLWFMRHKNYFDYPKSRDHAVVFVFNHISYIDIPFLMKVFRREYIRILGKAELSKVPIFGLFYRMAVIPVKRTSPEDRARSIANMRDYLKKNISIVIAPEGTFNMTHKPLKAFYDGAFRVAIETNTNIQPVVFLDSYDRLNYRSIFSLTPGRSRAHFLQEIETEGYTLEDVPALRERVYHIMEEALIRYKASWIIPEPA